MPDIKLTQSGLVRTGSDQDTIFLAAKAPGQVAAQVTSGASVERGAASGNANYDPSSGRFATKENKSPATGAPVNPVVINPDGLPQGVSQDEWDRRKDAVKDAARSIETFDDTAAANFLQGRVGDLSQVDVAQFQQAVLQQKEDDLTDIFADQLTRGKNIVTMKAPKTFSTRAFGQLNDDQVISILNRLVSRGFDAKKIKSKIITRLPNTKQSIIKSRFEG